MFPIIQYPNHKDKRHTHGEKEETMVVKLNTHNNQLILNMKRNKMVIPPSFHIESLDEKGQAINKHKLKNCYYRGKLDGVDQSTVALSTCNGLVS